MVVREAGYIVGIKTGNTIKYVPSSKGKVYPSSNNDGTARLNDEIFGSLRYATLHDVEKDLGSRVFHYLCALSGNKNQNEKIGQLRIPVDYNVTRDNLDRERIFHPDIQNRSLADIVIHRLDLHLNPLKITTEHIDLARYEYIASPGENTSVYEYQKVLTSIFGNPKPFANMPMSLSEGCQEGGYLLIDREFMEKHNDPNFIATDGHAHFWQPEGFGYGKLVRRPLTVNDLSWLDMRDEFKINFSKLIFELYLNGENQEVIDQVVPVEVGLKGVPVEPEVLQFLYKVEARKEWAGFSTEATIHSLHRLHRQHTGAAKNVVDFPKAKYG